jgi:hypothetical protein
MGSFLQAIQVPEERGLQNCAVRNQASFFLSPSRTDRPPRTANDCRLAGKGLSLKEFSTGTDPQEQAGAEAKRIG